jgi:phosphoenolpyruvate---glycerone phosphotransferase subunit DhaL
MDDAKSLLGGADIRAIISRIAGIMTEKKEELIRLDGAMGDGDLGLTMERGFSAAREEAEKLEETDLGKLLMKVGMTIARIAPSTMGTLVGTGFMSGGKAVSGKTALGAAEMAAFFDAFAIGVMARGKSKPGEKTIVDVLQPASKALTEAVAAGASLPDAFSRLREGAAQGLAASKEMIAQHGRVAYYQEQSKGREDPGAVACAYIIQGFCDHVSGAPR